MDRYRARAAHKTYNDPGPDLLREKDNARKVLRTFMGSHTEGWFVRKNDGPDKGTFKGPLTKAEVLDAFDAWGSVTDEFVLAHRDKVPAYYVKREDVKFLELANCSRETSLLHSLIHHQFPHVRFAGGYLYRQIAGSTSWSDHAWGTAIDESENPPEPTNDETTDWVTRMGRTGNAKFDYLLGSRNGQVVTSGAPDYELEPSSAASTHLWHNHVSIVDHDGRKPPHEGGA